ncbi:MAG: copper chaperone PCu(A)C [Gordonia sp. (in: high G+C Gram-positive bacteria)]
MTIRLALRSALLACAAASTLLLAGCGGDSTDAAPKSSASQESQNNSDLAVSDQWVKAAKSGMTSAFATVYNTGEKDVRIVAASSDSADKVELHENADGKMKEKKGGFLVPANGELSLTPGGDHLMLVGLKKPINAGQSVSITLRLADGSTQTVDALARDFEGNKEDYDK